MAMLHDGRNASFSTCYELLGKPEDVCVQMPAQQG